MTVCPKCNYDLNEEERIYQNAVGVELRFDIGQSLAGATKMQIHVEKPGGTVVSWTATQYGSTQYITYTTIAGDFDVVGDYKFHAYVEWGSTGKHHGRLVIERIYPEFEEW
jgi:hypothetical protein